jgi:phage terminase small subunit
MPALKNTKHEKFAQGLAQDLSSGAAYAQAGYKRDDGNACRLTKNDKIIARVDELRARIVEKVVKKAAVSPTMVVEELAKIGFSNMQDYMRVGANGDPVLDFSKLSRDQAAALTEVTVDSYQSYEGTGDDGEETTTVKRVKFKLADKRAALVDIGKILGMFKERIEHSGTITFEHMVLEAAKMRVIDQK